MTQVESAQTGGLGMNGTTTSCREPRPRATNRRYGWLLALSLALLTSALGATLLQAVLSPQLVA